MANGFSRKVLSTVVASSLLLSVGGAAVYAAPKGDTKETGRTEQQVQSGVISNNDVTVERYQKEVRLTGTVVIDGPQLDFSISGVESEDIKITKIGDKTWMYEAVVDVQAFKGNTDFEISAKTIYPNGKNAGAVHTSAKTVTQTIHVPHVTSTVAKDTEWTAYNRSSNEFTLSYNEVENWSVGDPVETKKFLPVSGLDANVTVLDKTVDVPIAIQDFTFSPVSTWVYNTTTNSVEFNVIIKNSKGDFKTESVTKTGLTPGEVNIVSHTETDDYGDITKTMEYAAPVVDLVVDRLENLVFNYGRHNKNQFKVTATYQLGYSNGNTGTDIYTIEVKLGDPNPESKSDNPSTRDWDIDGFIYKVTLHYDAVKDSYSFTSDYVGKK